jgi:uncharacterized membrane protein YhaH (DUF805 family)
VNFVQSISSGFSNYVNFSDRAIRSEYWYWVLFLLLALGVAEIIDSAIGFPLAAPIVALVTLLPNIAVQVRRLHDLDRSGWWVLLHLIPIVGGIVLIIWYCTKGTASTNRFGPDRLAAVGA